MITVKESMHNFTEKMKDFMEKEALDHLEEPPSSIWNRCVQECRVIDKNFHGIDSDQARNIVYNVRRNNMGGDSIRKLEIEMMGSKTRSCLRHSFAFVDENGPQRIMMFSDPELLDQAKNINVRI